MGRDQIPESYGQMLPYPKGYIVVVFCLSVSVSPTAVTLELDPSPDPDPDAESAMSRGNDEHIHPKAVGMLLPGAPSYSQGHPALRGMVPDPDMVG